MVKLFPDMGKSLFYNIPYSYIHICLAGIRVASAKICQDILHQYLVSSRVPNIMENMENLEDGKSICQICKNHVI